MLYSAALPTTTSGSMTANVRELLLMEYGKRFFREQNPNNVRRRFVAVETWLQELIDTFGKKAHIDIISSSLRLLDGSWRELPVSFGDIRRFALIARFGHQELERRQVNPDVFVSMPVRCLAIRLYQDYCSHRDQ